MRYRRPAAAHVYLFAGGLRYLPDGWRQAVGALEWQHPAGIFWRQSTDFVELLDLLRGEIDVHGGDVVLELLDAFGADDDAGYYGFGEQPRQRDAGGAAVVGFGDGSHD